MSFVDLGTPGAALATALADPVLSHSWADMPFEQRLSMLVQREIDWRDDKRLQRLLKAAGHEVPAGKPALEINPEHPLLQRYDAEADAARRDDLGLLLFEQAQLAEGAQLDDPAAFVRRMNALLLG